MVCSRRFDDATQHQRPSSLYLSRQDPISIPMGARSGACKRTGRSTSEKWLVARKSVNDTWEEKTMRCLFAVLAMLLYTVTCMAETTYYTRQSETSRAGRRLSKGADSHSCEQARNVATPKASVNGGIGCLVPGDTLRVGKGTYREILLGSYNGNTSCLDGDASVQQPCKIIPSGSDADHLTSIVGDGEAVVAPNHASPGGGGILSLYDASHHIRIEGLRFNATGNAGAAAGVHLGNSQYVTLHHNEISGGRSRTGALVSSSKSSRYHTITANNVHHGGEGCDRRVDTSPPCVHGLYYMGQDHWIADNYVHHNELWHPGISGGF